MSLSLRPASSALEDALRSLERTLEESRTQWNDSARGAFDRRHAVPIVSGGRQTQMKLQDLARDFDAALRLLRGAV